MAKFAPTAGTTGAGKTGNGLGPLTRIVTIAKTNMTQAELDSTLTALASGVTVSSVFYAGGTIAGVSGDQAGNTFVSGTSDLVHVAIQGGDAPEGTAGSYTAGVTVAVVAVFQAGH